MIMSSTTLSKYFESKTDKTLHIEDTPYEDVQAAEQS